MSTLSIAPYFPYRRVRVASQRVRAAGPVAEIAAVPDRRFTPRCHGCGQRCRRVHSWEQRAIRDLNLGEARVVLRLAYRKLRCRRCARVRVEDVELCDPYARVTKRLARYIHTLCRHLPVQEVAAHLGLDWKTVKAIDQTVLEATVGETDYTGVRILAIDEIAVRKGFRYMTVVLDFETGRVVWMERDRTAATLHAFFGGMTPAQKAALQAIAIDMWDPYIKAIREAVPHVQIVFDLFHVVSAFNQVIAEVRNAEYRTASAADRRVIKGSRYLLVKTRLHTRAERDHLNRLLALNHTLCILYILKELLRPLWRYRSRGWAQRRLDEWCSLAYTVPHPAVRRFARRLARYGYGIVNHCDYPIHTGRVEGVNNTIKVIKRKAYGFHDDRYFALKVIQAFPGN